MERQLIKDIILLYTPLIGMIWALYIAIDTERVGEFVFTTSAIWQGLCLGFTLLLFI